MNLVNPELILTKEQIDSFKTKGYTILKQFLLKKGAHTLKQSVSKKLHDGSDKQYIGFNKSKYDLDLDNKMEYQIIQDPIFKSRISELTGRTMFFAQSLGFELEMEKDNGFPWHTGRQSFGYQRGHDYACTLWIPLDPVRVKEQHGGMAYVPKNIVSGRFMYDYIDHANILYLKNSPNISLQEYFETAFGTLNFSGLSKVLEVLKEEDSFELGDAFIFDKDVIHRSAKLIEGPLQSRTAIAFRLIDINSRYDQARVEDMDYVRKHFNLEDTYSFAKAVCQHDGEVISKSPFFSNFDERVI